MEKPLLDERTMARNILIVEDNELQRTLYTALSRRFNLKLNIVTNCKEAVEVLETNGDEPYQLILMDLGLSDINGCECARRIRDLEIKRGSRTPIVAVTGQTSKEYENSCYEAGMDGFLSKPFSIEQFADTLLKFCGD